MSLSLLDQIAVSVDGTEMSVGQAEDHIKTESMLELVDPAKRAWHEVKSQTLNNFLKYIGLGVITLGVYDILYMIKFMEKIEIKQPRLSKLRIAWAFFESIKLLSVIAIILFAFMDTTTPTVDDSLYSYSTSSKVQSTTSGDITLIQMSYIVQLVTAILNIFILARINKIVSEVATDRGLSIGLSPADAYICLIFPPYYIVYVYRFTKSALIIDHPPIARITTKHRQSD